MSNISMARRLYIKGVHNLANSRGDVYGLSEVIAATGGLPTAEDIRRIWIDVLHEDVEIAEYAIDHMMAAYEADSKSRLPMGSLVEAESGVRLFVVGSNPRFPAGENIFLTPVIFDVMPIVPGTINPTWIPCWSHNAKLIRAIK